MTPLAVGVSAEPLRVAEPPMTLNETGKPEVAVTLRAIGAVGPEKSATAAKSMFCVCFVVVNERSVVAGW